MTTLPARLPTQPALPRDVPWALPDLCRGAADAPALLTADRTLTYAALGDLVAETVLSLGSTRRLVLLEAGNDVASVVTYLAALAGGHPVVLASPGDLDRRVDLLTYDPDVVQPVGGELIEIRSGTAHELHRDLAVLMSTSGSTGSAKLVRLSHENLRSNASAIATYLRLCPEDRAITSLPLHYCYGLSVLNSHLIAGASLVLTDLSVADRCFWELAADEGVTSFAGVPYTFDLLDASGFADVDLPALRYVTQAGGRMEPEQVRRFAEIGERDGWDLFVMYGQTEATARMAYLPPDLATSRPEAVGVPIPGGSLRLVDVDEVSGVGELMYAGPNVMLGYATSAADLALGPTVSELRTGDLARQGDDDLWEVVGRVNRVTKVFGLRLDLEQLERQAAERGCPATLVARPDRLWAFVDRPRRRTAAGEVLADLTRLPASALRVEEIDRLPLTATGKPDLAALDRHVSTLEGEPRPPEHGGRTDAATVRDVLATTLARPDATEEDSFVALGGDSLSYVEASTRLGRVLGTLPHGWQHRSPRELAEACRQVRTWGSAVEPSILVRAAAIVVIVLGHVDRMPIVGGAHVLLAVVGFNLARFQLRVRGDRERVRAVLTTLAWVGMPAMVWIGVVAWWTGDYRPQTALMLNGLTGSNTWTDDWRFWFLEVVVWGLAGVALLLSVPAIARLQRARPFAVALALVVATLTIRYAWVGIDAGPTERYTVGVVLWCVTLGWLAAEARTSVQRLLVVVLTLASSYHFFDDLLRETVLAAGIVLLLVARPVRLPRVVASVVGLIAAASLWIYLTHWSVYEPLETAGHPWWAFWASLTVGIGAHLVFRRSQAAVPARRILRPTNAEGSSRE